MGQKFSRIENLWPRDGSCPLRFPERIERAKVIQKHELPILEYDSNSEEVIRPNHGAEQLKLPEKCVYAFLGEAVDDYAFEAEATVAETFETITRNYPVYIVPQMRHYRHGCRGYSWPESLSLGISGVPR